MKKLLLALAILLMPSAALAQKTKAALATEVNTNLASNGNITASILRATMLDLINSYYDLNGLTTVSCGSNTFVSSFPTLSSVTCTQPTVSNISGFGTGAATALGVNVGTAGAFVVNGGALGTPTSGGVTNLTGIASGITAGTVTTNANLTGDVTSVGNATTLTNAPVIAKVLTGYVSGAGTVSSADSILSAIQKVNGNDALKVSSVGLVAGTATISGTCTITSSGTCPNVSQTAPTAWTPADASGAGLVFTSVSAEYTVIGNIVVASGTLTYPTTANGSAAQISGFPVNFASGAYGRQCSISFSTVSTTFYLLPTSSSATAAWKGSAGASLTNAQLSTALLFFQCIYPIT